MQCGRGNQRILFHIPEKMLGSCIFVYCTGACDNPASSSGHKNQPEDHGGRKLLYGTWRGQPGSLPAGKERKIWVLQDLLRWDGQDRRRNQAGSSGILYRDPKRRERTEKLFPFGWGRTGTGCFLCTILWLWQSEIHGVLSETQVDRTRKNKDYRDQNTGSMETAAAEYRNLYGSRHAFGVCTSKTPGNDDVWVTSYERKQIRSRD